MSKEQSRPEKLGIQFADSIIETAHLTYNAGRGKNIVKSCIKRLRERIDEIQPKTATPKYKEARYEKKECTWTWYEGIQSYQTSCNAKDYFRKVVDRCPWCGKKVKEIK